jgi:acetoin utilization protein AcuC
MDKPRFFYSDALMNYDLGEEHPLKPERLRRTVELIDGYGLFTSHLERVEPELADTDEVAKTHSREYLEALFRLNDGEPYRGMGKFGFGTGDNPIFRGIYEASLRYTGASIGAAQAINDGLGGGQVAFNISGGLHHAHYAKAAGFCVLNDCACAARRLRQKFARVAYVDIDVHHGDGVQELFYDDPSVLTISLHESGHTLFPGTGFVNEIGEGDGVGYSVNVPHAPYVTDDVWIQAWREAALPILEAFDPEAIVLQMGTDPHVLDPLAHACLTAQGWLTAVKDVQALDKPIVAIGGGGYNLTTVPRMWTAAVAALAGADVPDETPESYRWKRDIPTLTDHAEIELDARTRETAQRFADKTVADIQRVLFPIHGLKK